jgi:predicted nucleic acid-binding protein
VLGEIPLVCRDPNDDKILATALAGLADLIATEDKDLLDMGEYEGIRIVNGRELLGILHSE